MDTLGTYVQRNSTYIAHEPPLIRIRNTIYIYLCVDVFLGRLSVETNRAVYGEWLDVRLWSSTRGHNGLLGCRVSLVVKRLLEQLLQMYQRLSDGILLPTLCL